MYSHTIAHATFKSLRRIVQTIYGYNVDDHNFQIKRNGQHQCTFLRKHALPQETARLYYGLNTSTEVSGMTLLQSQQLLSMSGELKLKLCKQPTILSH